MIDCRIRGATLVDGTGAPARRRDVDIADGKIVAVGTGSGPARRFGLRGRGRIARSWCADLVVFDFDTVDAAQCTGAVPGRLLRSGRDTDPVTNRTRLDGGSPRGSETVCGC